ncbi:MAG: VWA domain-containing protein [Caldilineaceae bacterium]
MTDTIPTTRYGHLLPNIVHFGRLLRGLNIPVTPAQMLDFVAALEVVDLRRREDVQESARAIFVSRREHLALFDEAFALFWRARPTSQIPPIDLGKLLKRQPGAEEQYRLIARSAAESQPRAEDDEPFVDKLFTASEQEALRHKDFARMSNYELAQVKEFMQALPWQPPLRRTHRRRPDRGGNQLDLRRTFRHNLRYGGESLRLAHRQRTIQRRRLVVLCDISGSMDRYARVLLQFLYGLSRSLDQVEAFVFSTRLTRITRQLQRRSIDEALDQAAQAVHDWAGGTRIGEAIHAFNFEWGRRVLGQGAVVMVISDGWDRGEPAQLDAEMARLHRSCHRLIWLNPLLGSPTYQPLTRGIQAALPHVDDFLPVHNLVSLEQLAQILAGEKQKPGRRFR